MTLTGSRNRFGKMADLRNKLTALLYCALMTSSLSTGALAQQLVQGQTQVLHTIPTDEDYSSTIISRGYDNSLATNVAAYATNPVHGQYWANNAVPHSQVMQQPNYVQHPLHGGYTQVSSQAYPSQFGYGYQPQQYQYGSFHNQYPGFNAQYWTGRQHVYPAQLPVYRPNLPLHRVPVHYPSHPIVHHGGYAMRRKYGSKGFLGGTGNGIVKGVLGAVLAGVVAGKVAKGK